MRKCTPGNIQCGGRCIPEKWICRANSPKKEENYPSQRNVAIAATTLGVVALSVVAFTQTRRGEELVKSYGESVLQDVGTFPNNLDTILESSPDFSTFISDEDRRAIFGLSKPPNVRFKTLKIIGENQEKFKDVLTYKTGEDLHNLEVYPEVSHLLKTRNIDLSKIHYIEVYGGYNKSKGLTNFVNSLGGPNLRGASVSAGGETLIFINKSKISDPIQLGITRSHETIHAIQANSGWVLSNEKYSQVLERVLVEDVKSYDGITFKRMESLYEAQYKALEEDLKKRYYSGEIKDPFVAAAAGDIVRRMEIEAWWACNFMNIGDLSDV